MSDNRRVPIPELRIVQGEHLYAHESHDSQRSRPLIERFRNDEYIINPPIVAPLDEQRLVILDGANRCHALRALGYPHMLVQVVTWESGQVLLDTWKHVVSDWTIPALLAGLASLSGIELLDGAGPRPVAEMQLVDGRHMSLVTAAADAKTRNRLLCEVVDVYQKNATLFRSILNDLAQAQEHFPHMVALLRFPDMQPSDIATAASQPAWIPPGVSRHIILGRALRVHYPIRRLGNDGLNLAQKNAELRTWMQEKLAQRQVRFYAESTWQFDE